MNLVDCEFVFVCEGRELAPQEKDARRSLLLSSSGDIRRQSETQARAELQSDTQARTGLQSRQKGDRSSDTERSFREGGRHRHRLWPGNAIRQALAAGIGKDLLS